MEKKKKIKILTQRKGDDSGEIDPDFDNVNNHLLANKRKPKRGKRQQGYKSGYVVNLPNQSHAAFIFNETIWKSFPLWERVQVHLKKYMCCKGERMTFVQKITAEQK